MLDNFFIFTTDIFWKSILSDLGAHISDKGIKLENPKSKLTIGELINHLDNLKAAYLKGLGAHELSDTEQKLILMLPSSATTIKIKMGYAEKAKTHTVETLIYNIRKKLGQNFIKLENGEYRL